MAKDWDYRKKELQSKSDLDKNTKRITDIINNCDGDVEKEAKKAKKMANSIDKPEKAYNRGYAAKELEKKLKRSLDHIFEPFYQRAYELGSVTISEHREHMINKILKD